MKKIIFLLCVWLFSNDLFGSLQNLYDNLEHLHLTLQQLVDGIKSLSSPKVPPAPPPPASTTIPAKPIVSPSIPPAPPPPGPKATPIKPAPTTPTTPPPMGKPKTKEEEFLDLEEKIRKAFESFSGKDNVDSKIQLIGSHYTSKANAVNREANQVYLYWLGDLKKPERLEDKLKEYKAKDINTLDEDEKRLLSYRIYSYLGLWEKNPQERKEILEKPENQEFKNWLEIVKKEVKI